MIIIIIIIYSWDPNPDKSEFLGYVLSILQLLEGFNEQSYELIDVWKGALA